MSDNIDIVVREDGSSAVQRNLSGIGSSARDSAEGVELLRSALATLTTAFAVDKILEYADAWNSLVGLVNVTTNSTAQAAAVTNELYNVAQKTRQPIDAIANLYNRAALQAAELGASQSQLIQFTKEVGESLTVQHTSTTKAAGSLLQLAELIGTGTIKAQQYNSVLRGLPALLQIVAKNMDGTGGTVAGLTARIKSAGKVTSEEFFQALLKGAPELQAEFLKTSYLFSQGFTVISNAVSKWIGKWNEAFGASNKFAEFSQYFSEHADQIMSLLAAIGAAIAVAFAPAIISSFLGALVKVVTFIATNPFTALISAIAGLITYVVLYGDSIDAGIDKTTTLKDVGIALVDELETAFGAFFSWIGGLWNSLTATVESAFDSQSKAGQSSTESLSQTYSDFFTTNRTGVAAWATYVAKTIDAIAGFITGLAIAIARVFTGLPDLFANIFDQIYNAVVTRIQDMINAAIDGVNKIASLVGKQLVDHVQLATKQVDKDYWSKYGQNIADGIDAGFEQQGGFMQKWLDGLLSKAQEIGKTRRAAGTPEDPGLGVNPPKPPAGADEKGAKAREKLINQLAQVIGEISPLEAAKLRLAKAEDVLNKARAAGLITGAQEALYMDELKKKYQDALDPIGAVTRKLQEEADTYKYVGDAQQAHAKLLPILEKLRKENVTVTQEQTKAFYDQIVALEALKRANEAQNEVLNQTVYAQRKQMDVISAIAKLKEAGQKNGGIAPGQAAQAATDILGTNAQGTDIWFQAQVQNYQNMYQKIDALRKLDIISEHDAAVAKANVNYQMQQLRLTQTTNFLSAVSALQNSNIREFAALGKAAAIVQATINTYEGASKALAQGGIYGTIMAAVVVAQGLAQVAAIRSQQLPQTGFRTGGDFIVGGSGGPDTTPVQFMATPGEQVNINTPSQARAKEQAGNQKAPEVHVSVVNVDDPKKAIHAMDTSAGKKVILNHMQSDPTSFKRVLGIV